MEILTYFKMKLLCHSWLMYAMISKYHNNLRAKWVKVIQSCPTLCDPVAYTVHGILQARILEWVAIPFSGGSSQPRNQTHVSYIGRQILYCLSHQRSPFLVRKHHESLYMISLSALVPPLSPVFHTLCFIVGRREILNKWTTCGERLARHMAGSDI